jgi:hypothetical protein
MIKLINKLSNLTEREGKIFSAGVALSSIYCGIMFGLCSNFKFNNIFTYFGNMVTNLKRTKLLNGNKNIFYFDDVINETLLNNFKDFINCIKNENETIHIILSTNGGSFSVVQMISEILLNWKGETNAVILNKAFSAGTLIALSCKNIYMHSNAHLSPVDVIHDTFFDSTQLTSISYVLSNKNHDRIDDHTFILADQAKKCKFVLDKIFNKICIIHKFDEKIKLTVYEEIFEGEKYTHCTTFSRQDLIDMGLKISPMTEELLSLSKLTLNHKKENYL